jgi:hypothetical protein
MYTLHKHLMCLVIRAAPNLAQDMQTKEILFYSGALEEDCHH